MTSGDKQREMALDIPAVTNTNPWHFFILALGLSWLFWIPLALLGGEPMQFPYIILMILGGLGPAAAEIILIFGRGNRLQKRDYWRRVLDARRISLKWLAIILLIFPLINAVATGLSVLTGGPQPTFATASRLLADPLSIIPYVLFLFLFGPLPEELGWSGYALDGLQTRRSALSASLLIGVAWAAWHLPLFFMEGTFQSQQIGFMTPAFWWYILPTLPISVLDTWVYNNANRSTLAAVLLHFMVNFSGEIFGLSSHARFYQALLIVIVTAVIVVLWGPRTLKRDPWSTDQMASPTTA
jgi:membrane protease YdiL (CAAX protease family)